MAGAWNSSLCHRLAYGTPEQRELSAMTVGEAEQYIAEGHFAKGSMLPKVEAALSFARSGGTAVIAALADAAAAAELAAGTVIKP